MTDNKNKKGKYFEVKTAQILKELYPNQIVKPDIHLLGKLSKTLRQIDVLIEPSQYSNIIFECKNHERPVDLDTFGVFTNILQDINTGGKAAMVSNSPYTKGVTNMALNMGIDLLHIIDTEDPKIRTRLCAPTLLTDIKLKNFQLKFETTSYFSGMTPDVSIIKGSHFTGTAKEYLKYLWNNTDKLAETTGDFDFRMQDVFLIDTDGNEVPFTVTFLYGVEKEYYYGTVDLQETQGIYNVHNKSFQTKYLKTASITPYEVEQIWKKITKSEIDKCQVTFEMGCKSIFG